MSDESIKPPAASDNILTPFLIYCGTKARVLFDGDCLKQNKVPFNNGKILNIYIVHEIIRIANINCDRNSNLTVKNTSFGAVSLTKYGHLNKYKYCGYGAWFDRTSNFSFPGGWNGQNVIIFGV